MDAKVVGVLGFVTGGGIGISLGGLLQSFAGGIVAAIGALLINEGFKAFKKYRAKKNASTNE